MKITDVDFDLSKFNSLSQGVGLLEMFARKENFLVILKPIEDFTNYPLDLSLKENQLIIKDFVGRITEELMESFEKMDQLLTIIDKHDTPLNLLVELIYETNEEFADVMHFMIELMILLGITYDDIMVYFKEASQNVNCEFPEDDDLSDIMYYARHINVFEHYYAGLRNDFDNLYRRFPKLDTDMNMVHFGACTYIGIKRYQSMVNMSFNFIFQLNMLRGLLKKKPWRDNHKNINNKMVKDITLLCFSYLMRFYDLSGYDANSNINCYMRKNIINIQRVKEYAAKISKI